MMSQGNYYESLDVGTSKKKQSEETGIDQGTSDMSQVDTSQPVQTTVLDNKVGTHGQRITQEIPMPPDVEEDENTETEK